MADERDTGGPHAHGEQSDGAPPFRRSGSADEYDPAGNWGAERRPTDVPPAMPPGMAGAPSGAGDGGYGPEGGYSGPGGEPNADVLGQVHGDTRLVREAQELGSPEDRSTGQ